MAVKRLGTIHDLIESDAQRQIGDTDDLLEEIEGEDDENNLISPWNETVSASYASRRKPIETA